MIEVVLTKLPSVDYFLFSMEAEDQGLLHKLNMSRNAQDLVAVDLDPLLILLYKGTHGSMRFLDLLQVVNPFLVCWKTFVG